MAKQDENIKEPTDAQFSIQKVYVKDLSFETPNSPDIFKMEWKPVVDMHMTNEATPIGDDLYDVVLSITLTVKLEEKTAYLVEINQAGIFLIKNIPEDVIERMLATVCANILFPFAREAVSDTVTRGGFPQLLLSPVNFDALYAQQQTKQPDSSTTH
ncbi:MAG TPA: protein-export chaperone SecB [Thiotrichaceae bacterium]|jgi:preprotein translocase subunit SecB|nr:protein-export chaperone SecB [Thiotrichaceae bacterium]HIM07408.1 protein-export chaperone SecB [Gammaproteobacteria bacterium]